MRARKFLLIAVVVIAAVAAARVLGLWVGGQFLSPPTSQTAPLPALVFAEDDLTFGPIPESEAVERELRLTNTSAESVTVVRFEKSCTCLGIEPSENVTLQPGETKALRIQLKASITPGAKVGDDGMHSEEVGVTAVTLAPPGAQPNRFSVAVRYTVRQTVSFDQPSVLFGTVSHRETVKVSVTLSLVSPITDVRVLPHPEWVVNLTAKGDTRELVLTPTRPGVPRVVNDTLQVVPVGTDGGDRSTRPLSVRGEIRADVIATPADISLGRVKVGAEVEEHFKLSSLTRRSFTILDTKVSSSELNVTTVGESGLSFVVRVRATSQGDQERTIEVRVMQDDGRELTIKLPVRYLGHTES